MPAVSSSHDYSESYRSFSQTWNPWKNTDHLQELAEDLKAFLDVDVTIADCNLMRLAGTGPYEGKVGTLCPPRSAFGRVVRSGKNLFLSTPRKDPICLHCSYRANCPEKAAIDIPILVRDRVVGVIGLIAFDVQQRSVLIERRERILRLGKYLRNIVLSETTLEPLTRKAGSRQISISEAPLSSELEGIVGKSDAILRLKSMVRKIASSLSTVLITGESGTGKELVARAIHSLGERKHSPFVPVNCGALPEPLIESELFGYESGAFTGAKRGGKPGMFELAHGGTIFLDEIGEIPPHLQVKLHRVLQERAIMRVGGRQPTELNVRIIAATNRDLRCLSNEGVFRKDLYYRLNVIPLHIPPLRERKVDIIPLTDFFLRKFAAHFNRVPPRLTCELATFFGDYPWPGNVRELENFVEYGMNFCDGEKLNMDTMKPHIQAHETDFRDRLPSTQSVEDPTLSSLLSNTESERLVEALREYGYSLQGKRLAASRLGISLATLYRKLKRYNIVEPKKQIKPTA